MEADLLARSVFRRGVGARAAETGEDSTSLAFELDSKLHELQQAWETPPKGSAQATAVWNPVERAAQVAAHAGKHLHKMGYRRGGHQYLHIEEALYLIDRAELTLYKDASGGCIISKPDAYDLLEAGGASLQLYVIYSHIMRASLVARRHPSTWTPLDIDPWPWEAFPAPMSLQGTSAGKSAQLGTGPGDLQPQQPQQHGVDQSSPVAITSGQAKARLQRPAGESQQQQQQQQQQHAAAAETCNPAPVTAQSQPFHTSYLHSGDAVDRESARVCPACDTAAEGHAASALPAAPAALIVETLAGIEAPHVPPWQGAGRTATESRLADKHRQWWLSRSDDLAGLPMAEPPSTPGASLSASGLSPAARAVPFPALDATSGSLEQAPHMVYDIFRSVKAWTPKVPGPPLARVCLAGPDMPSIFQMLQAEHASPGVPVKWAICRDGTAAFHGFEQA